MAFFVQALFAIGFTRAIGQVYAPNAVGVGNWRAVIVGNEKSGEMTVNDADDGVGVFLLAPAPVPAAYPNFSQLGDEVELRSYMLTLVLGFPLATAPLATPTVQRGIIFTWVELPAFPGLTFAIVYVNGDPTIGPDVLVLADPAELTLIRRNPALPP